MTEEEFIKKWAGKLKDWRGNACDEPYHACAFGAGWLDIADRLITDLFALGWDGTVAQTKEKFGGLRFYIGGGTDAIFTRIDDAELESYQTCEVCGQPGVLHSGGWLKTLCDEHAKPLDGDT